MKIFVLDDEKNSNAQLKACIKEYAEKMGVVMEAHGFTDVDEFLLEYEQSEEKP